MECSIGVDVLFSKSQRERGLVSDWGADGCRALHELARCRAPPKYVDHGRGCSRASVGHCKVLPIVADSNGDFCVVIWVPTLVNNNRIPRSDRVVVNNGLPAGNVVSSVAVQ